MYDKIAPLLEMRKDTLYPHVIHVLTKLCLYCSLERNLSILCLIRVYEAVTSLHMKKETFYPLLKCVYEALSLLYTRKETVYHMLESVGHFTFDL